MRDETLAIHAGYQTDPTTKAVVPPICQNVYNWLRLVASFIVQVTP